LKKIVYMLIMPSMIRCLSVLAVSVALAAVGITAAAGKWPWQRRIGRDVEVQHKLQHQRVSPDMWPPEPASPSPAAPGEFTRALSMLCGPMPPGRLEKFSAAILEESAAFEVDPFLVAALVWDQSRCLLKTPDDARRYGLTRIDVDMHAPHIRNGSYAYWTREAAEWSRQSLAVDGHAFNTWTAARWDSNLYWTAAILRVFSLQHESLDRAFPARPHRHYVSHWFWGDNVLEIEPEDRVLTTRRRLLSYYRETGPVPAGELGGTPLVSPLDGVPRLVLDNFGNRRGKKGGPGHQGIDLVAPMGEPIRAMAAGRVVFAGVDSPGSGSTQLTPREAETFPPSKMGKGGLYVAINHGGGFRTYYMHMDTIAVKDWDEVEAGEIIGTVGRSGATESGPHLHLEFRVGTDRVDPAAYMQQVLVDPARILAARDDGASAK
jgi:murein DD-endopeptidase MepM/ murein hydrolase activator NlpD